MTGEGADQVRVLDLFVEVADKAAAGQMGRCNFVERTDFLFAGGGIIDYNRTGDSVKFCIIYLIGKFYNSTLTFSISTLLYTLLIFIFYPTFTEL